MVVVAGALQSKEIRIATVTASDDMLLVKLSLYLKNHPHSSHFSKEYLKKLDLTAHVNGRFSVRRSSIPAKQFQKSKKSFIFFQIMQVFYPKISSLIIEGVNRMALRNFILKSENKFTLVA